MKKCTQKARLPPGYARLNMTVTERRLNTVLVGGTFDELHKGHRALLIKSFDVGERVIIGLSSDQLAKELRKNHVVASFEERLEDLRSFLKSKGVLDRAKIVPLDTPYGITLTTTVAEALVVSKETEPRAKDINKKRKASGINPLQLVVIEMVPAEDYVPISSTRIRHGEIDREGHLIRHKEQL
jgi:pantetheine-phosphate adenylyltransferase